MSFALLSKSLFIGGGKNKLMFLIWCLCFFYYSLPYKDIFVADSFFPFSILSWKPGASLCISYLVLPGCAER